MSVPPLHKICQPRVWLGSLPLEPVAGNSTLWMTAIEGAVWGVGEW